MSDKDERRSRFYWSLHEARLLDARAAIQAGLHINGLAVTAMLALLASIAPKIGQEHAGHIPFAFVRSLRAFGVGVFAAALAATTGYIANHLYAEQNNPSVMDETKRQRVHLWGFAAYCVGYAAALLMLVAFLIGVAAATSGLERL